MSNTETKNSIDKATKSTATPAATIDKALTTPPVVTKSAPIQARAVIQKTKKTVAKKATAVKQIPAKVATKPAAQTTVAAPTKAPVKPVKAPAFQPQAEKPSKQKKPKLVRDSFTIPKTEYMVLDDLKQRSVKLTNPAKKSELIRAGIKALAAMSDAAFAAAIKAVPTIKTGRPAKS